MIKSDDFNRILQSVFLNDILFNFSNEYFSNFPLSIIPRLILFSSLTTVFDCKLLTLALLTGESATIVKI